MTKRFDPKTFKGRRVYSRIAGAENVQRVWVWDGFKNEYRPPERGQMYRARRWEVDTGKQIRKARYFETLEEARAWRDRKEAEPTPATEPGPADAGPPFGHVIDAWKKQRFPGLRKGTRESYSKLLRLYLRPLRELPVRAITPAVVDDWIAGMIEARNRFKKGSLRTSFKHELTLLTTIMNHYAECADDAHFVNPVRRRHRRAIKLSSGRRAPRKLDIVDMEVEPFVEELARWGNDRFDEDPTWGDRLATMTKIQFELTLRISEAAAIAWENVHLDFEDQSKSRVVICQYVEYLREKGAESSIQPGFKNSDSVGGIKVAPLTPKAFAALALLWRPGAKGLVFHNGSGGFLKYRHIEYAYNRTFKALGLPYTATHVMRHGGVRKTLDETGGDRDIAAQQLGNRSARVVETYAVRSAAALTRFVEKKWEKHDAAEAREKKSEEAAGIMGYQGRPRLEIVREDQ